MKIVTGRNGKIWRTSGIAILVVVLGVVAQIGATDQAANLAKAMETNTQGLVRLKPAWTGIASNTFSSGYFTNEVSQKTNRELRFDVFGYFTNRTYIGGGPWVIGQSTDSNSYSDEFTYRKELPSDAQIIAATNFLDLDKLLGLSHSPEDCCPRAGFWQFFRIKDDHTAETLSVAAMGSSLESTSKQTSVHSLEILRGVIRESTEQ